MTTHSISAYKFTLSSNHAGGCSSWISSLESVPYFTLVSISFLLPSDHAFNTCMHVLGVCDEDVYNCNLTCAVSCESSCHHSLLFKSGRLPLFSSLLLSGWVVGRITLGWFTLAVATPPIYTDTLCVLECWSVEHVQYYTTQYRKMLWGRVEIKRV